MNRMDLIDCSFVLPPKPSWLPWRASTSSASQGGTVPPSIRADSEGTNAAAADSATSPPSTADSVATTTKQHAQAQLQSKGTGPMVLSHLNLKLSPGKSTLILAARGHGKSSLLRLLAGQLPPSAVTGSVLYGGRTAAEWRREEGVHVHRLVRYVDQIEWTLPQLTVRQTLTFAQRTQCVPRPAATRAGSGGGGEGASTASGDDQAVEAVLDTLGLTRCADTIVGDALTRGISGGERRRVALAEGLLSDAQILCCDEVTTGLDSARAGGVAHMLGEWARAKPGRMVVAALLQPTPEVVSAFDDVIMLHHGCVVYHGPTRHLHTYARTALGLEGIVQEGMGLQEALKAGLCPAIVETLSASQGGSCCRTWEGWQAAAACSGQVGGKTVLLQEAGAEGPTAASTPAVVVQETAVSPSLFRPDESLAYTQAYPRGLSSSVYWVLWREWLLVKAQWRTLAVRMITTFIVAVVIATGFTNLSFFEAGPKLGYILFILTHIATITFQEMPRIVATKTAFAQQVRHGQYPAVAPGLAALLFSLPITAVETTLYACIVYWASGLDTGATAFMLFLAVLLTIHLSMASFFRAAAYAASSADAAQVVLGLVLTILELSAGYLQPPNKLGGWLWLYYTFPYGYALRALAWNEFQAPRYDVPAAPGVPGRLGTALLDVYGIDVGNVSWAAGGHFIYAGLQILLCTAACGYFLAEWARPVATYKEGVHKVESVEDETAATTAAVPVTAKSSTSTVVPAASVKALADAQQPASSGMITNPMVALDMPAPDNGLNLSVLGIPLQPTTLCFLDIRYSVPLPATWAWGIVPTRTQGGTKQLLKGITGMATPGTLTALMGGSGAGKTTLLDVLAGRKTIGEVTGTLALNGRPVQNNKELRHSTGYCEQSDIHEPWQTVREALYMSAALRTPPGTPMQVIRAIVEGTLQELDLLSYADHQVGVVGVKGGLPPAARKLLTIAVEVVACKPVIFLDEPTSGMDSQTAEMVVGFMKRIAQAGRTVVATIHQPSEKIFHAFDNVLLLAPGGYQAYAGPREGVVPYLSTVSCPGVALPPFEQHMNPATWMMRVTCAIPGVAAVAEDSDTVGNATPGVGVEANRWAVGEACHAAFKESGLAKDLLQAIAAVQGHDGSAAACVTPAHTLTTFTRRLYYTSARWWAMSLRNGDYTGGRVASMMFIGILLGWIYLRLDYGDIAGLQALLSVIIMSSAMIAILPAQTYLAYDLSSRAVLEREVASGAYGYMTHCVATFAVETVTTCLAVLPAVACIYYMVGMSTALGPGVLWGHFTLTNIALAMWFTSLIQASTMIITSVEEVQSIILLILVVSQMYSGVYIPGPAIAEGWKWWFTVNPLAYAAESLLTPQVHCYGRGSGEACPTVTILTPAGLLPVDREEMVTTVFGLRFEDRWLNLGYIAVWIAALQLIRLVAAYGVRRIKR